MCVRRQHRLGSRAARILQFSRRSYRPQIVSANFLPARLDEVGGGLGGKLDYASRFFFFLGGEMEIFPLSHEIINAGTRQYKSIPLRIDE